MCYRFFLQFPNWCLDKYMSLHEYMCYMSNILNVRSFIGNLLRNLVDMSTGQDMENNDQLAFMIFVNPKDINVIWWLA